MYRYRKREHQRLRVLMISTSLCMHHRNSDLLEVCESPQTTVVPGRVKPCSGPIMWTIPDHQPRYHIDALLHQREPVLTLTLVIHTEVCQTELFDIVLECADLRPTVRFIDESSDAFEVLSWHCSEWGISFYLRSIHIDFSG